MDPFYVSICKNVSKIHFVVFLLTSSLLTIHKESKLFSINTRIDISKGPGEGNVTVDDNFILPTSTGGISEKIVSNESQQTDQITKEADDNKIVIHYEPFTNFIRYRGTTEVESLLENFWQLSLCGIFLHKRGKWISFNDKETKKKFDHYPLTVLRISLSCKDIFYNSYMGTGNYILLLYKLRMVARQIGNTLVQFSCIDAESSKNELILPWLMGEFSPWDKDVSKTKNPTIEEECNTHSISHMIKDIQKDLRRMAIAVTGIPFGTNHPSEQWATEMLWSRSSTTSSNSKMQIRDPSRKEIPVPPTIEYDDVAIHFRCGDIVDLNDTRFGFMKFTSISKYISPNAQSIAILTQPFEVSGVQQSRAYDASSNIHERCRLIVTKFQEFLQIHHKNARISIRNDPNVTLVETYSRLIMANQTIIGTTSFGAIAGIASFGTSYILNTNYYQGPNQWLLQPNITTLTDNVILIDEPILFAKTVQENWLSSDPAGQKILDWLQNDDAELNNVTVENVGA